jgi:hypothetical protein
MIYSIQELQSIFPEAQEVIKDKQIETLLELKDANERIESSVRHYFKDPRSEPICRAVIEYIYENEVSILEPRYKRLSWQLRVLNGEQNKSVDIEALKLSNDITSLIEKYGIRLKKTGNKFMGLCPFHKDTNFSLCIYPKTQSYFCFGCNKSGDIISFIQEIENCGFKEAIKML